MVTGGAKRLGRASALKLAQAGADVAITFRNSAREARETVVDLSAHGVRAFALKCDVTDEASIRAMMKDAGQELGRIDILVNNAANYESVEFEKLTAKQWDAIFASNTRAPFLVAREALRWMRRKRPKGMLAADAKIINMGSLGGLKAWANNAHYCSSKAALHMLTKVMAKALAPEIAVNAVAPGMIDMGGETKSGVAFLKRMAQLAPMQRNGRDEDVAAAVLFFATAPQFITGQILAVDGGLSLLVP